MSQFTDAYDTVETVTDSGIRYFFLSEGKGSIIKIIQYTYIQDLLGRKLYNLGFGDYDLRTGSILDDLTPNNGDPYRIFHTVLSTIPSFFNIFPNAMMFAIIGF